MLYFIFENFKHIVVRFMHSAIVSTTSQQNSVSVGRPTMGTLNGYAIWHICVSYMYYIVNKFLWSYVDYIDCITVVLIVLGYTGIKV